MNTDNQMLGGSTAEMNNQSSNFSANDASFDDTSYNNTSYNDTSATTNASENFTSTSDNYVNGGVTNNGVNNNQSAYTTSSTTHPNGGRQHESVGCLPVGNLKQGVKTAAKELFGLGRHKNGCQHGSATTTTSTCSCTNQANCPHRTQNCDCNETDTYNSSTLSDNKTSNFSSNNQEVDSYNNSDSFNSSANGNFNGTDTISGQAGGEFSTSDSYQSNGVGGEQYSAGGPVGGNNY